MKAKKLISFFLFLVLSIQTLPLKQITAWLTSGQLTEEIAHNPNPVKAKSGLDEVHPAFTIHAFHDGLHSLLVSALIKHHRDEALFIRHAEIFLRLRQTFPFSSFIFSTTLLSLR